MGGYPDLSNPSFGSFIALVKPLALYPYFFGALLRLFRIARVAEWSDDAFTGKQLH
jgi:hypothetical protein